MFQIDNSTAVAAIPAPTAAGSPGYFTDGNPAAGVSATILPAEFMNMLMMENLNVLIAGGITPAKGQYNQLSQAITKIVQSGTAGQASESVAGIMSLSTKPQVIAGVNDSTAVTPLKLSQKLADYLVQATEGVFGWLKIATQVLVNGGVDDSTAVSPKKLAVAIQSQALNAFSTGGVAGALTLTPIPAIEAYAAPLRFRVKFSQNSTGADTINVSGKGEKALKQYDSAGAKVAAIFAINQLADVEYDGTDAVLLDQLPVNYLADPWALQPLGVPIGMFFDTAGAIPPTNNSAYRYIKLTSGDAYNDGVLTSESVSGAAPLILASAVISLAGSPFNGLTVQLINTERRALRAGAARTIEQDQIQNITGAMADTATALSATTSATGVFQSLATVGSRASPQSATGYTWNFDASRVARAGTETRSKNVGVTYFMRIK